MWARSEALDWGVLAAASKSTGYFFAISISQKVRCLHRIKMAKMGQTFTNPLSKGTVIIAAPKSRGSRLNCSMTGLRWVNPLSLLNMTSSVIAIIVGRHICHGEIEEFPPPPPVPSSLVCHHRKITVMRH